jgi:hypothetical protein
MNSAALVLFGKAGLGSEAIGRVLPTPLEVSPSVGISPKGLASIFLVSILNKKCYVYIIMKYFIYAAKKPLNREINFPIR